MNDLGDILRNRLPIEPPELKIVRRFVEDRFGVVPRVSMRGTQCIIGVPSGAVAGALRLRLMELHREIKRPELRLLIRIEHSI